MEPLPGTPQTLRNLAEQLARAITETARVVQPCRICQITATTPQCPICADPERRQDQICLVAESIDVPTLERLQHYRGRYHVLHGLLSPLDGITPDRLTIAALMKRLDRFPPHPTAELIIATPATLEGDLTADYVWQQCVEREYVFSITRLRRGLAYGSRLEYAHPTDITAALANRQDIDQEPVPPPSA